MAKNLIAILAVLILVVAMQPTHQTQAQGLQLQPLVVQLVSAQSATAGFTTPAQQVQGKLFDVFIVYAGITGSPATCTIQLQASPTPGVAFVNQGSATAITPATGATSPSVTQPIVGSVEQFAYTCGTFPTAGTMTIYQVFHQA